MHERRGDSPAGRAVRRARRGAWVVGLLVACYGLWVMADDIDGLGRAIPVVAVGDVVLGMAYVVSRDSLDPARAGRSVSAAAAPVVGALLLEVVVGFLLFPVTIEDGADPDRSWFAVVPLVVVFIGGGAFMLTLLAYLMVVARLVSLVLLAPAVVRGEPHARVTAVLDLVLVVTVAMAVSFVLVVDTGGRRINVVGLLATLLGLQDPVTGSSAWELWLARALLATWGGLLLTMRVLVRRHPGVTRAWQA